MADHENSPSVDGQIPPEDKANEILAALERLQTKCAEVLSTAQQELGAIQGHAQSAANLQAQTAQANTQAQAVLEAIQRTQSELQTVVDEARGVAAPIATISAEAIQHRDAAKTSAEGAAKIATELGAVDQQARGALDAATKAATEIPPAVEAIKKASAESGPLFEQLKASKDESVRLAEQIKTDGARVAEILRLADEKEQRVQQYEKSLAELQQRHDALYEQINKLLPGATGIALSNSFGKRRLYLLLPLVLYFSIFLASIAGFIWLGWHGLVVAKVANLEEFFKYLLERAPIVVGLILMEEFSRRQYSATAKLREDYAYKETISIAFDGYKKVMSDMTSGAESLAVTFSKGVIDTLRERPGRLLEKEEPSAVSFSALFGSGDGKIKDEQSADALRAVVSVKNALQSLWVKGVSVALVVLVLGIAIGYYIFAGHNGTKVDASMAVTVPQVGGVGAKK